MTGKRARLGRLLVAALLVVPLSLSTVPSSTAAPNEDSLAAAQARYDQLNEHLSLYVEQYNAAQVKLDEIRTKLAQARQERDTARQAADDARRELARRAVVAYQGVGSQLGMLLNAENPADFSDRLEFLNTLAQNDTDLANEAETQGELADRAAAEYSAAVAEQTKLVEALANKKEQINAGIAEQKALIAKYEEAIRKAEQRRQQRLEQQQQQQQDTGGIGGTTGDTTGTPPPVDGAGARAAINAAYSVLGTPYKWGGSSPEEGFDCSGLTMWSWAHAGVSLPHSSAAQYSVLPHVDRSQIQPGDLLFFYSPIHHVGLYIGGNSMIDANHPGDVVAIRPITWDYYVGAGRPG